MTRLIDADVLKKCLCKKDADYDKPIISPKFLEDYIDDMIVNQTPTYNVYRMPEVQEKQDCLGNCGNCGNSECEWYDDWMNGEFIPPEDSWDEITSEKYKEE